MTIQDRIKTTRRRTGLTQEEFAAKIGTSQKVVSRWEKGVRPRDAMLEKIAEAGSVTYVWLSSGEGEVDDSTILSMQEKRLLEAYRNIEDKRVRFEMIARIEYAPAIVSDLSRLNRRIGIVFSKEDLERRYQIEQCLRRRLNTIYEELALLEGECQEMEEEEVSYIRPKLLDRTKHRRDATREKIENLRLFDEDGAISEIQILDNENLPTTELLEHLKE